MTHEYGISGMTCAGCQATVKALLEKVPEITNVDINLQQGTAAISMSRHVSTTDLQSALKDYPQFQLREQAA